MRSIMALIGRAASLLLKSIAWVSALFIMLAVPTDVASRTFAGRSIPGVVELAQFALVALVAAGLALAERDRLHIDTDLVTSRLPRHYAKAAIQVARVASLVAIALIAVTACIEALSSFVNAERSLGTVRMPIWPSRAVLALGFVALAAFMVRGIVAYRDDAAGDRREQGDPGIPPSSL